MQGLIDAQPDARDYEEEVESVEIGGAVAKKAWGRGRVAYIPAVRFDGPLPEFGRFFQVDPRFWKLPRNAGEITDAVRWAARDDSLIEVTAPPSLVANVVEQPVRRRTLIHLVNYSPGGSPAPVEAEISCRIPAGKVASGVRLYSPEGPDGSDRRAVPMKWNSPRATFKAAVRTYMVAEIDW